jgi:adenine-specific DNA methylase
MMRDIFTECKRVLKDNGKLVFIYGHKTLEGWEVIANALKGAELYINNVYPLDMERPARPRAMSHQSLNGVVVFEVLKKKKPITTEGYFESIQEVPSAHIPIHLAGLACKMYANEEVSFKEAYQTLVDYYQQVRQRQRQHFVDPVLGAYISAVQKTGELTQASKQLLEAHQLINDKGELYTMDEIVNNVYQYTDTAFDAVLNLYSKFSNNTKTKIDIDARYQKDVANFFTAMAGVDLNTLSNRSFDTEKKVARLILAKMNVG